MDGTRKKHSCGCIVNVGLFRSGTTSLCEAAKGLGLKTYRTFPNLSPKEQKEFLCDPQTRVLNWFEEDGLKEIIRLASEYDLICDGWIALLPFLPPDSLDRVKQESRTAGVHLEFVATSRDVKATIKSELQHWTVHDLEKKAGLDAGERASLERYLAERAAKHQSSIEGLHQSGMLKLLPLRDCIEGIWPKALCSVSDHKKEDWEIALQKAGKQNANPRLPLEGILLTLRLGTSKETQEDKMASVERLLGQIEEDSLCQYLLVLGIDEDEVRSNAASELIQRLQSREEQSEQLKSFHCVTNPTKSHNRQPFAICSVWDNMASVAWKHNADWVVLLGDDIEIDCPFHYRAFYRSFLDIETSLNVPFGFGCPWWNDLSFPGFPSFPCVGKAHLQIFGGLIPKHRHSNFVNQDLDPYLHQLYLKFMASPCVTEARLSNGLGGNIGSSKARYKRIPAQGWQDFCLSDVEPIRNYLPLGAKEAILLDVVVPSYRVRLDYLESICSLEVPEYLRTLFIIIIDNTDALLRSAAQISGDNSEGMALEKAERILEEHLSNFGNHIRVRCNKTNVGASASRNRGLDESAAEFVLNLDDDLIPNPHLLKQYGSKLLEIDDSIVGLVGLVRFPRSSTLPLRHAAVLMSYLTFMFEIATKSDMYLPPSPAWGVTANILFRRTKIRFDLAYAKTGGGEDVDFSLRVAKASNGGKLLAVPEACVVHPFWPGSVFTLSSHFFNWAIGDGALFKRFPNYRYWSFPNFPETLLFLSPLPFLIGVSPWHIIRLIPSFLVADFMVDFVNQTEFKHRCDLLQEGLPNPAKGERSRLFYLSAHFLANIYVIVLEFGRLWGHMTRLEPWTGICQRFDWHCGRLKNAPRNFRHREACKFGLFVAIAAYEFGWNSYVLFK